MPIATLVVPVLAVLVNADIPIARLSAWLPPMLEPDPIPMLRKPVVDANAPIPKEIFVVVFLVGLMVSPLIVGVELETTKDPVITAFPTYGNELPPPPPVPVMITAPVLWFMLRPLPAMFILVTPPFRACDAVRALLALNTLLVEVNTLPVTNDAVDAKLAVKF